MYSGNCHHDVFCQLVDHLQCLIYPEQRDTYDLSSFNHNSSKWKVAMTSSQQSLTFIDTDWSAFTWTESQLWIGNGLVTGSRCGNRFYIIRAFETWSGKPEPGMRRAMVQFLACPIPFMKILTWWTYAKIFPSPLQVVVIPALFGEPGMGYGWTIQAWRVTLSVKRVICPIVGNGVTNKGECWDILAPDHMVGESPD